MTVPKVELGRHLFYDARLSKNETMACATCHRQALAFTDGRAVSVGSTGQSHSRGAMSLANVGYSLTLTSSHPYLTELERQAAVPLFGDAPVELGFTSEAELVERLAAIPEYEALFAEAFPDDLEPLAALNVERALASFQRQHRHARRGARSLCRGRPHHHGRPQRGGGQRGARCAAS